MKSEGGPKKEPKLPSVVKWVRLRSKEEEDQEAERLNHRTIKKEGRNKGIRRRKVEKEKCQLTLPRLKSSQNKKTANEDKLEKKDIIHSSPPRLEN